MKEPFIVSIDEAGQITLPLEIREGAHLAPGTQLVVSLRQGRIELEPAPSAVRVEPLREQQVVETVDEIRRIRLREPLRLETYRDHIEFQRIGTEAALKAQEENRQLGIPNAFCRNGKLYFEMPDGEITQKDPFVDNPKK